MNDELTASKGGAKARRGASTALRMAAILGLGLGCSESGDAALDAVAGGWSNEPAHLLVCVASDGRMWLGDSASDVGGASPCQVSDTGTEFHCQDRDDGSSFDGSIAADGDTLTLEIAACDGDAEDCRATYVRDPSVTCGD